ncbi:MAG: hypothetical protein JWQ81_4888 [Amycolatopsis sp.]|jgi:hypothetical protein|nr:hypothetical protein [Amycolatopsis sp.]
MVAPGDQERHSGSKTAASSRIWGSGIVGAGLTRS